MISVILCTHNPRRDYLDRTLEGLKYQEYPLNAWELLVVDNASTKPLADEIDLSWHPRGRLVTEPETGLTAARLRGFESAKGSLFVCVDDDNVLAPDYLARAAALGERRPSLGVWGCGTFYPQWEGGPPGPQIEPYLEYLAVGQAERDRWSNQAFDYGAMPAGAGLCARAEVARRYAEALRLDPRRKLLGRAGAALNGCEDFELALNAIDGGFETGVFRELRLAHLIPQRRQEEDYLLRLVEGHTYSTVLLHAFRGRTPPRGDGWIDRVRDWRYRRTLDPVRRSIHQAKRRGQRRAFALLDASPELASAGR